ncbi:nicotinamidase-related amidase [Microbacterium sp. BE35]|uniref:cysteine hydrolase n=1 Tax=Microbacterium sp. BE35 TaxID=2817773 RepID=UPI00285BE663|nr:cysteine hydrolase [Microbacterium sp. BE35]MDR7188232.1 nicotinamidase-related amidase [Microbacterium sp. BE35]
MTNNTALIVLDVQNDTVSAGGAFESNAVHAVQQKLLLNIARLLEAARTASIPVIHIHFLANPDADPTTLNTPLLEAVAASGGYIAGTWGAAPAYGAEPLEDELVLTKTTMSGFAGTGLQAHLDALGVERLVLTGALTNMSVEHTARHAADEGFRVVVVSDATSSMDAQWHSAALDHAISMVAQILDTEQAVKLLHQVTVDAA